MQYDAYEGILDRLNADVHFIVGAASIVFNPNSTWKERGEGIVAGGIMTMKVLVDFVNPLKKFSMLARQAKRAKDFKILRNVI